MTQAAFPFAETECPLGLTLQDLRVDRIPPMMAKRIVVESHYLHRAPPVSHAFGLLHGFQCHGVVIFGCPASRHLQLSVLPTLPDNVIELNRLWTDDTLPKNAETWFLSRALKQLPARVVVSYADTAQGHLGYVYRAANFHYAGWTDMERKTPRFDYVTAGSHSRESTRRAGLLELPRVRRKPKMKYWTVTGPKTERRFLGRLVQWPKLSWKTD